MRTGTLIALFGMLCLALRAQPAFDVKELEERSDRAAAFLKRAQLPSGAIQDSTNALFNVWETILVADALLDRFPETDQTIRQALLWLETKRNPQLLICHNEKCTDSYCIETSALYLQLLARSGNPPNLTTALTTIRQLQETNGSWKVGNPDVLDRTDFPSVTAFVLQLLYHVNGEPDATNRGYVYLAGQQLEDGSFGQTWEYYNCPGYALWQCMPAFRSMLPLYADYWHKGLDFILTHQLPDGSWNYTDPEIAHRVSPQLQTAFMLTCLQNVKGEQYQLAFRNGLYFLLRTQLENGAWDGGFFPIPNARYQKREYLIATALIYKLLVAAAKTEAHE
jgi:hypothetical protein